MGKSTSKILERKTKVGDNNDDREFGSACCPTHGKDLYFITTKDIKRQRKHRSCHQKATNKRKVTKKKVANSSPPKSEVSHHNRPQRSGDVFDLLSKHFASLDCTKRNNSTRRSNSGKKQRPTSVVWNQSPGKSIRHRSLASYELNNSKHRWSIPGRVQKQRKRPINKTLSLPNNVDYSVDDEEMISISNYHNAYRRSKTPDPTALHHQSNLDWTTANSLERRRKRESSESNASSDNVPHSRGRSKSLTRPELDGTPWDGPAAFYIDKNGRARQLGVSPSIPSQWMDDSRKTPDNNQLSNDFINETIRQEYNDEYQCSPEHYVGPNNRTHTTTSAKEDDELTHQLIKAMKELKDIAEVARVIDKVDNEEWLMVFIGELGHMLRDLVQFGDVEENPIKKSTLLDVLLDMIRFLKERSGYKEHSRYSIALREGLPDDIIQENPTKYDTIKRLKKLSEKREQREKEMEKWQKQLINLAGTLEKCLVVLEDKKSKTSTSKITLSSNKYTRSPVREYTVHSGYSSNGDLQHSPGNKNYKSTHKRAKSSSGVSSSSGDSHKKQGNLWVKSPSTSRASFKDDSWLASPRSSVSNTSSANKSRLWPAYNIEFSLPNVEVDVPSVSCDSRTDDSGNESPVKESVIERFISEKSHDHPIVKRIIGHQNRGNTLPTPKNRTNYNKRLHGSNKDPSTASVFDKIQNFEGGQRPRSNSDGSKLSQMRHNKPSSNERRGRSTNTSEPHQSKSPSANQRSANRVREFVYHVPTSKNEVTKTLPTLYRSKSVEPKSTHRKNYNNSLELSMGSPRKTPSPLFSPVELKTDKPPRSKKSLLDDLQDFMVDSCDESYDEDEVKPRKHVSENAIEAKHKPVVERNNSSNDISNEVSPPHTSQPKPRSSIDILLEPTSVRPKEVQKLQQAVPTSTKEDSKSFAEKPLSRISTRSMNTQCDLLISQSKNEKNALDQMKQLKRRVETLQGGLKDARAENFEKERKISVLEARLERTKKNVVYGETEKGALEEEIDRMKKENREGRRDLRNEITALKIRLEEAERKLEKEKLRSEKAEHDANRLREELKKSRKELQKMKEERDMMEQHIQSLNTELMNERGNNRSMQEENNRLEVELSVSTTTITRLKKKLSSRGNQEASDETAPQRQLEEAQSSIDDLTTKNDKLSSENKRLLNALISEQMMSSDAATCFLEQVKHLNDELRLARECSELQAKEYEKEIGRLLAEKRKLENQSSEDQDLLNQEIDRLRDLLDVETAKAKKLNEENQDLRSQVLPTIEEGQEVVEESIPYYEATTLQSAADQASGTVDQGVQYDDTSYTKMRAFEFYSLEAQRNAKKLTERGRQLDEQLKQKRKDLRERRNARK